MREELTGGKYAIRTIALALADLARGVTYTEATRRAQVAHAWAAGTEDEPRAQDGSVVAGWADRFGPVLAAAYGEKAWPQTLVLDSTEFMWKNPRTGNKEQMFAVLAAWGYPEGAARGRMWALSAAPSDDADAWKIFLGRLPGRPELVIYDSDKAIDAAVRQKWPTVPIHLCEHHLYNNAKKHLRADGQHGWGNNYRTLLAAVGQSPQGWASFRDAVLAATGLTETEKWVRYWDEQMITQTTRRASMPAHYSTGALDPKIALVREHLERRRWTFRNEDRMNALLGLVRLHINRLDVPDDWARLLTEAARAETQRWNSTAADRRKARPRAASLDEKVRILPDGSRSYSLRKHPVPPRAE